MSTRGIKNEDLGRLDCKKIARFLREPRNEKESVIARMQCISWLEAIGDGGDPAEVIFGGKPYRNDHFNMELAIQIYWDIRMGLSQGDACRSAAEKFDIKYDRAVKIYQRYRDKVIAAHESFQ